MLPQEEALCEDVLPRENILQGDVILHENEPSLHESVPQSLHDEAYPPVKKSSMPAVLPCVHDKSREGSDSTTGVEGGLRLSS